MSTLSSANQTGERLIVKNHENTKVCPLIKEKRNVKTRTVINTDIFPRSNFLKLGSILPGFQFYKLDPALD